MTLVQSKLQKSRPSQKSGPFDKNNIHSLFFITIFTLFDSVYLHCVKPQYILMNETTFSPTCKRVHVIAKDTYGFQSRKIPVNNF